MRGRLEGTHAATAPTRGALCVCPRLPPPRRRSQPPLHAPELRARAPRQIERVGTSRPQMPVSGWEGQVRASAALSPEGAPRGEPSQLMACGHLRWIKKPRA